MQAPIQYSESTRVSVYPFTRQREGEEVVIGRPDTGVFLALPEDAVEILDDLAAGKTIGEAQDHYQQRHGDRPDLEDLLAILESKGLVRAAESEADWQTPDAGNSTVGRTYHFTFIPRRLARALFGSVALAVYGVVIALGTAAVILDPSILPPRDALVFESSMSSKMLILVLYGLWIVFVHEMAHLIAVRATGVDSRLGIGNRLWMLVAETDMSALWSLPKSKRYLPLLAGPIIDLTSVSAFLLVLAAERKGWLALGPYWVELLTAASLIYFLGLIWQCFFFVRTDFYYVFSTFFGCKNLLLDAEGFLRNRLADVVPWVQHVDQSGIPEHEMKVVRGYTVIWLLGRVLSLGVLFLVILPMLWTYTIMIGGALGNGFSSNPSVFIDALLILFFALTPLLIGLWMWSSSLVQRWRKAT